MTGEVKRKARKKGGGRKTVNLPTPPKHQGVGLPQDCFQCSLCKAVKHYSFFYAAPKSYTGYQSRCKECTKKARYDRLDRIAGEIRQKAIDRFLGIKS